MNLYFMRNGEPIPVKKYVDMIIEEKFADMVKAEKHKEQQEKNSAEYNIYLSDLGKLLNELVDERNQLKKESVTIDECNLNAVLDVVGLKMQVDWYDDVLERLSKVLGGEYTGNECKKKIKFK